VSSIVAVIAKRRLGKVKDIIEEAIKKNVQKLKFVLKFEFIHTLPLNSSGLHAGIG